VIEQGRLSNSRFPTHDQSTAALAQMIEDRVEPGRSVAAADQIGHLVSIRPAMQSLD
jgi:hypothetical protein